MQPRKSGFGGIGFRVAAGLMLLALVGSADANTVTFDWVSTSGTAASGFVSLTSPLITGPNFNLTATGAAAVADISAFNITFGNGESMTFAKTLFANSTGWSDNSSGKLTSTWNASESVTNPSGTLQVSSVPYAGTSVAQSVLTTGTTQDFGYWQLQTTPVPVPAAAWLFGSGFVGLTVAARRRRANS